MKVLVTGSHGFVGTNLVPVLKRYYEVVYWDARQDAPLPAVDAIIHLAGKAHDVKNKTLQEEYIRVNTAMTQRLYDRFLESSAQKFIFFSSIKAQDANTPYALSKKAAEEYIQGCHRDDKMVYVLRPCMIYGPGNKGNLNLLLKVMRHGIPWPLAAFNNQRSFASIDNVIYVVNRLLAGDVASGVYPVCDDETVSTNDLVQLICEGLGIPCRMWSVPPSLVKLGARIGDVLHLPLNSERLRKLTENYIVDNSKIKAALHINQMPVRAEDGLRRAIKSMIENPR